MTPSHKTEPVNLGRYVLFDEIASGGMASVYFARLSGAEGFSRVVAIKRLHPQHAKDAEFRSMFVDEARIASRIRHPNVVVPLDVVATDNEVFLVMEYVHAEPLSSLAEAARKKGARVPLSVTVAVVAQALRGLHAAHTAVDTAGAPLGIIHRDISPHNLLVGADGIARLIDFGIAKAEARSQSTQDGQVKGKLAYMAPEQLVGGELSPAADIYAMGIVLWELVAGERMFESEQPASLYFKVMNGHVRSPRGVYSDIDPKLEALVMRALSKEPANRFPSAKAMAEGLESLIPAAASSVVAQWVEDLAGANLEKRAQVFRRVEAAPVAESPIPPTSPRPLSVGEPALPQLPPLRGPMDGTLASVGGTPGAMLPMSAPLRTQQELHRPRASLGLGTAAVALGTLMVAALGYVWIWPAYLLNSAKSEAAKLGYRLEAGSASGSFTTVKLRDVDVSPLAGGENHLKAAHLSVEREGGAWSSLAVEGAVLSLRGRFPGPDLHGAEKALKRLSFQGRVEWDGALGEGTLLAVGGAQLEMVDGRVREGRLSALRIHTPTVVLGPWALQREATEQGQTDSLWLDATNMRPAITCALQAASERCDVQINRASLSKLGVAPVGLGLQTVLLQPNTAFGMSGRWVRHEQGAEGAVDGTLEPALAVGGISGVGTLKLTISGHKAQVALGFGHTTISGPVELESSQLRGELQASSLHGKKAERWAVLASVPFLDLGASTFSARF